MPDNRKELMQYRLEMAKERLHSSEILLKDGSYKDSIGRFRSNREIYCRELSITQGVR